MRALIRIHAILILSALLAPRSVRALDHGGNESGTWRAADSPHRVVSDVTVPLQQLLVIEPGCAVTFAPGTGMLVRGTLSARGSSGQAIWMVSAEERLPGAWNGITISADGDAVLEWVGVRHAATGLLVQGGGDASLAFVGIHECSGDGATFEWEATGRVEDSTFAYNASAGLRIADGSPVVMRSSFVGNERAIAMGANTFPTFYQLSAYGQTGYDAVVVDTTYPLLGRGTWTNGGLPYVLEPDSTLVMATGSILVLYPGTTVKMGSRAGFSVAGTLGTLGDSGAPCTFTALSDDTVAGDTNADGAATVPGKGDWDTLEIQATGLVTMERTEVAFAEDGLRVLPGGRASLLDCEMHHCRMRGAAFGSGTIGYVERCSFHDDEIGVQVRDVAGMAMGLPAGALRPGGENVFSCNGTFDVENLDAAVLPALRNFWSSTPPSATVLGGPVDTGGYLVDEPAASVATRLLRVGRMGDDLVLRWHESSSCALYDVLSSDRPNGPFQPAGARTSGEELVLANAASISGMQLTFYKVDPLR